MCLLGTSALVPNPQQPRRIFDHDALLGLGNSMKESGQIHPLIVDDVGDGTYIPIESSRNGRRSEMKSLLPAAPDASKVF